MQKRAIRIAAATATGAAALILLGAGPASAHVSADKAEVPAGGFTSVGFTVPHGCEESPTTAIAIQIPEGIYNASPQVHPGWDITVEQETLAPPVTGAHGNEISERPSVITFTAQPGNALPNGYRDVFNIGFQAPDTPGETMFFPIVQTCEAGEMAWIEQWDGDGEEPEHPAPAVVIGEAEGAGHGHSGEEAEGEGKETVDGERASSTTADNSDSSTGIAIAGLAVGALGLVTGAAALLRTRKKTS